MDNKQYLSKEEAKVRDEWKSADADGKYRKSGIIYWNHQTGKNYYSASGAGDQDMKTDILMSELAKLIVSDKRRIVDLLNESGVQTNSGISTNGLSDKVGKALYSNTKFAEAIAAEIIQSGTKLSADGTGKKKSFQDIISDASDAGKQASDAVKNIKNLIGGVFGGKKKNKGQAQASTDQLKENVGGVKKINDAGIGAAGYILIALGVSAAIGTAIYFVKK